MRAKIRKYLNHYLSRGEFLFTNSGRSALQALIEDFKLWNSKIILPSFICSNVFSPLLIQNNIKPILVDCPKKSFNLKLSDIKKAYKKEKLKNKIKSVLIVHTFGLVNKEIVKISEWCKKNKLILIEDCAMCMDIKYKNKYVGTFGDAAIFSFSKVIRGFLGGAYLKNKGKINVHLKPYKLNKLDIYRGIKFIPFSRKILDFLKLFKIKEKLDGVEPQKIEILPQPKIFDLLTIISRSMNISKRKKIASLLYNELKREIPDNLLKLEFSNNCFHSIPILVDEQDKVYKSLLLKKKINCGKVWYNPLSKDLNLSKKWELNKTPNVDNCFSERIVNIMIDDNNYNKKQIKKKASIISNVVKQYQHK